MSAPEVKVGQEWRTPMATFQAKVIRVQRNERGEDVAVIQDVLTDDITVGLCETLREMWVCVE